MKSLRSVLLLIIKIFLILLDPIFGEYENENMFMKLNVKNGKVSGPYSLLPHFKGLHIEPPTYITAAFRSSRALEIVYHFLSNGTYVKGYYAKGKYNLIQSPKSIVDNWNNLFFFTDPSFIEDAYATYSENIIVNDINDWGYEFVLNNGKYVYYSEVIWQGGRYPKSTSGTVYSSLLKLAYRTKKFTATDFFDINVATKYELSDKYLEEYYHILYDGTRLKFKKQKKDNSLYDVEVLGPETLPEPLKKYKDRLTAGLRHTPDLGDADIIILYFRPQI